MSEQPNVAYATCPTCGGLRRLVCTHEGTCHFEAAEVSGVWLAGEVEPKSGTVPITEPYVSMPQSEALRLYGELRALRAERDAANARANGAETLVSNQRVALDNAKVLIHNSVSERDLWQQRCTEAEQRAKRFREHMRELEAGADRFIQDIAGLTTERDQWREAKLALDTRLEQDDLKVEQFRRELAEAEEHERRLETATRTLLELHKQASGRTCQCRLCQMFRAALAAEEGSDG